jgi:hypothetical protein
VTLRVSSDRRKRPYAEPCDVTNACSHGGQANLRFSDATSLRTTAASCFGGRRPLSRVVGKERRLPSPLVRFLAWLKRYLRRLSFGGESQIAMESKGEEMIHKDEWTELPESDRGKWEAVGENSELYRRKQGRC